MATAESSAGPQQCPVCDAVLSGAAIAANDRLHGTRGEHLVARCSNCGAGVTLPAVGEDQLAAFYPEQYGPYDERMSGVERFLSRLIRRYQAWISFRSRPLNALADRPPGRGLNVGCGRGDLAAALASRGWAMSGIEPSPSACRAAAARGIAVRCGTLATVALEAEAYEAVVFRHSLEHISQPVTALTFARESLVSGGLVLVTVPNFGSWQARRLARFWFHLDVPRHRVHFGPTALKRALTRADLEVLSVATSSSSVGLPGSLQYRLFGRCLFPAGLGLRLATGLCALVLPLAVALDAATGGGDLLHAVARKSS
jgi:SAM-dependent methyltransferase